MKKLIARIIRHRHHSFYFLEASFDLVIAKSHIIFFPFSRYAKKLGILHCETFFVAEPEMQSNIEAISRAIRVMSRIVPWKSLCFDKALAAKRMLDRRGLQNTLYFGVMFDENKKLIAHAWLRSGANWIVGYDPSKSYSIVGTYASFGHDRPPYSR